MRRARAGVSRETRLLLTIALVATATLWVLARLRYPDREATPNPVPPILAQLSPPTAFEDITGSMGQLRSGLAPALVRVGVRARGAEKVLPLTAVRLQDDVAALVLPDVESTLELEALGATEVGRDRASGLAVFRLRDAVPFATAVAIPRRPDEPRILVAADALADTTTLRPVFVDALSPVDDPIWGGTVWVVPPHTGLSPGTPIFSTDGAFVGVAIMSNQAAAVVPFAAMKNLADRLIADPERGTGRLGVDVATLTPALARATGAGRGLVVTWVDPAGAAARLVQPADVVVAVDGREMPTLAHWRARAARLHQGEPVVVTLNRLGEELEVHITAVPAAPGHADQPQALGLTTRSRPKVGVEIVGIEPDSAAAQAGLQVGDVITRFGSFAQPTSSQITRSFAAADRPLVAAVTRGSRHLVVAIEKRR